MKGWLASIVLAGATLTFFSSDASAWVCYARGTTGATGWGSNYNLTYARRRALVECSVRTPRGARCFITGCR